MPVLNGEEGHGTRDSKRKRGQEGLHESEAFLRSITDLVPLRIAYVDREQHYRFVNGRYEEFLGRPREEILGKHPKDVLGDSIYQKIRPYIDIVLSGTDVSYQLDVEASDGTQHHLSIVYVPHFDEHRKVIGFFASVEDVTGQKRAEQRLRRRLELETLVADISTHLNHLGPHEVDSGISHALQATGEFAGVDRSYVFQLSDDRSTVDNTHEWCAEGIEPEIGKLQRQPTSVTPWWMEKLEQFEKIHIPRVADLPPEAAAEKEIFQAQGIQSLVAVPMVSHGRLLGFLGFDSVKTERNWTEEDFALLDTLSSILASRLERKRSWQELERAREELEIRVQERTADLTELNERLRASETALRQSQERLRTLAASLISAQEKERIRLSRELHDDFNQQLAVLGLDVGEVERRCSECPRHVQGQLQLLRERVQDLSDDIRQTAYRLHPAVLDLLGLVPTLKSYCDEFAQREEIHTKFEDRNVPSSLPQDVALNIFRIVQECLRNVSRHARAKRVSVKLTATKAGIHLSVKDTGVGFDHDAVVAKGTLGLVSIEERVRLIQGSLSIKSSPGRGTTIDVRVPLRGKIDMARSAVP